MISSKSTQEGGCAETDSDKVRRLTFKLDPEDRSPSLNSSLAVRGFPETFIHAGPVAFGITPARLFEFEGFRDLTTALGPACSTIPIFGGRTYIWRKKGIKIVYRSEERPVLWSFSEADGPDC